jgi:histidinol dehydrogenase
VTPLDRVGLYVPGGKAAYPSSVLMNAIPAHVAGVREIVMVVPTPDGLRNPLVLAAAHLAGVTQRVGDRRRAGDRGARVRDRVDPPVDKICGPATPTSPRRSAACSAPSASTWSPASPRSS